MEELALTNLARPWILARLLTGLAAAGLTLYALRHALRVLRFWRLGETSEGQLALERRAELVAALVQAGLALAVLGLAILTLGADRSAASIRGAMCAYGVLASSPLGFLALASGLGTALLAALWVVFHRLDLRLERPTLTRRKFLALLVLAPLLAVDQAVFVAFALDLDFGVVATCCSTGLDAGGDAVRGASAGGRAGLFGAALALAAGAALALFWLRRRPAGAAAWTAAGLSLAALVAMLPAAVGYVAPHAYGTPRHLCPFCLLQAEAGYLGWGLFGGLFAGAAFGLGVALVETQRASSLEPAAVSGLQRDLGTRGAIAWATVCLLAAAPVVRWLALTGGASLFP
ncbi:MAG: hypothetical protein AAGH15_04675 [Myxococcota bacterium]